MAGNSDKEPRNWIHFFLGRYSPPEFIKIAVNRIKTSVFPWIREHSKTIRKTALIAAGVIIVFFGILVGYSFYQSRKPQPIVIRSSVSSPSFILDEQTWEPLVIRFNGSAAELEMIDKEVETGITVNPSIQGTWRWDGDTSLVFTASQPWAIGKKYTVSFGKDFFPSHIKTENSVSFTIDDFELYIGSAEFYIDPENSSIKRVLLTATSNYPMDPATIENSIVIEPQITSSSGQLQKKQYSYTVSYNKTFTAAYIVSEPIGMPAKTVPMKITLQKGVTASGGQGRPAEMRTASVEIPGMTSYVNVQNVSHELIKNSEQLYDQVFILTTQGSIDQEELSKNISVWELPVDRPELPGIKEAKNYRWGSTDEMVPEVLTISRKVELEPIPNELKYNSVNSYKFSAQPGRYLYVKLNNGAQFYGGYFLNDPFGTIFQVRQYPKELAILSEGSILSFTGDKRLSMLTRGVDKVKYTIGRIRPDDINHLVSQTSGDMTNIRFRNYTFNEFNITEQYSESASVVLGSERDIGYFSFDFTRYLETIPSKNLRHGLFIFKVQGENPNSQFSDRRLIMVTDLGFFVKTNTDGTRDVFVQSIATGNPVSGAEVSVLGLNGNVLVSAVTGQDGHVQIPGLQNYRNERAPTVFTVRRGDDLSFMPFSAAGRGLDYSGFETGGIQGAADPKTLRAFLFSDRGIYRPGDEVRIGMVIKSGDWSANLARTPLEYKVTDSRGTEIVNQRISLSREGVEDIRFSTHAWSPTGTYTVSVYVIRDERKEERVFLGSQTVKVEEFLPDTLNVSAVFDPLPRGGWITPSQLNGIVSVRNLFGTPAAGNEVKAQITLAPGHQNFRQYQDYRFQDPFLGKNTFQEFLGTQQTDAEGAAEFELNLQKFEKATYRLSFYAEAFEKGSGRNVSTQTSVYVSPLQWLIGYKPDGSLNYIQRDTTRMVSFIAVNPGLEKTTVPDLTFTLTELRYVSVLVKQPNGVYKYQSVQKEYPISSEKVTIPAQGLQYKIPSDKAGEYQLVITGPDELEYNRVAFSIAGTQNIERSLNRSAELELTLNRNDFAEGETIEVMIKAPYEGAGLITIERDKVYAYKWFQGTGETTMQTIRVPAGLEGNGYVNVTYVRSQDSREIFMSPLSYGSVPFSVSKENRTNHIKLTIPEEAKPGKDYTINYSSSRRGKIIIYAVDEGILQLAGYQTPNPLGFFFEKRALEVKTAQILDLILPRYSIVRSMAAMGGGEGYEELGRNLNPFKRRQNEPVAYWSGIVDTGPESRSVSYRIPDYFNGTLRVMAVSVSDDAVGAAEDRSLIRSTFIISPNSPMMAAPGDEFEISLTVTNNQKDSDGQVRVQVSPSEHLTIEGKKEFNLTIPEGKDETIAIPVKAAGPVGAAEIRFAASNKGETSELASYMSVRPQVPYRVSLYSGAIKNTSAEVPIDRQVYEEFHTRDVSLSYLPVGMAKGLFFFLDNFPYGCTEQLISSVFPFLYPELFRELGFTKDQAEEGLNRVIGIIQSRLKEDGSIGVWTANSPSSPLVTVYAAHFLIEARDKGYYVSPVFMNQVLQSIRTIAGGSGTSMYDLANRAYAIYVMTLNETVTTSLIENLKRDITRSNKDAETDLPGLYLAGSYALLKKDSDAGSLFSKIKSSMKKDSSLRYFDDLMYSSVYLNMLARHFPQRLRDVSESLFTSMAQQLEQQSYTTFSASYALMAVDAYLKAVPTAETGSFTVVELLKEKQTRALTPAGTKLFSVPFSAEAQGIKLENKDRLNLFYQITLAGFDLEAPKTETKNGIEVYREFLNEAGQPVNSVKIGDTVLVKLNFRTLNNRDIHDVALVDLLPAGLEPDIESIRAAGSGSSWRPDYVDIREDRLVVFGTVRPSIGSFTYRTRAINSGNFTVPPLFAEALYDKSVWAMRPQENLSIQKNE
ncbi:alpha-2-macroglobulin family protein [Breznakiella homolactica]|uniref:Alpha-2-macroglobulin n=1 Tax=Breznakiella homolactica TaxID=2798577 RepID=A0A7T7XP87_9SPIR|nr:alpha-2-macroglobulin [Breznakiella homolactica]QQO09971.1 alpha-2-macroglobulin family protein [Breznakiella homolactica]